MYNQNDDLKYAIEDNGIDGDFTEKDIEKIVAEVPGANDEYDWHWIVLLKDGRFAYLVGGCDYTGWGCQSWLEVKGVNPIVGDLVKIAPKKGERCGRKIQSNLISQLTGEQPFGLYSEKPL